MKKLLAITLISVGTLASIGTVSALEFTGYPTWAQEAINDGRGQ